MIKVLEEKQCFLDMFNKGEFMRYVLLSVLVLSMVSCGKQTVTSVSGLDGKAGNNGHNSLIGFVGTAPSCVTSGVTLLSGLDLNDNGTLDDANVYSKEVCNGSKGDTGAKGDTGIPSDYEITELLDPCGNAAGVYDEVFLRLHNGTIVASFSENVSGKNTRFSIIWQAGDGMSSWYQTTDGSNCVFRINTVGNIVYN